MLDSLKQTGKNIGRQIGRAWEDLSEGWRELLSRSSDALTHFGRHKEQVRQEGGALTIRLPKEGSDSVRSIPVT